MSCKAQFSAVEVLLKLASQAARMESQPGEICELNTVPLLESAYFEKLCSGVAHFKSSMKVEEMLLQWLRGVVPPPCCNTVECNSVALIDQVYCELHACPFPDCRSEKDTLDSFCDLHLCQSKNCKWPRMELELYCNAHSCFKCIELHLTAKCADEDPPYNVCIDHVLCTTMSEKCLELCDSDSLFCSSHQPIRCQGTTKKGNACIASGISHRITFCRNHSTNSLLLTSQQELTAKIACLSLNSKGSPYCSWDGMLSLPSVQTRGHIISLGRDEGI